MLGKKKMLLRITALEDKVAMNEKITLAGTGVAALSLVMSTCASISNRSFKKVTAENSAITRHLIEELRAETIDDEDSDDDGDPV